MARPHSVALLRCLAAPRRSTEVVSRLGPPDLATQSVVARLTGSADFELHLRSMRTIAADGGMRCYATCAP